MDTLNCWRMGETPEGDFGFVYHGAKQVASLVTAGGDIWSSEREGGKMVLGEPTQKYASDENVCDADIDSCKVSQDSLNQHQYGCKNAFDGETTDSKNGWAFGGLRGGPQLGSGLRP